MTKRVIKKQTKDSILIKDDNILKGFLKILFIVMGVLIVSYLIIALFITKDIKLFDKNNDVPLSNTNNILITETFTMKNDVYYVFMYDKNSDDYNDIKSYLDNKKDIKIYNVDLSNSINKSRINKSSNREAQDYSELKINSNTLIKIENGKNTLYLEGKNEILNSIN